MSLQMMGLAFGQEPEKKFRWKWRGRFMGPFGNYDTEGTDEGPIPKVPTERNGGEDIRIGEGSIFDVEEIDDEADAQ